MVQYDGMMIVISISITSVKIAFASVSLIMWFTESAGIESYAVVITRPIEKQANNKMISLLDDASHTMCVP